MDEILALRLWRKSAGPLLYVGTRRQSSCARFLISANRRVFRAVAKRSLGGGARRGFIDELPERHVDVLTTPGLVWRRVLVPAMPNRICTKKAARRMFITRRGCAQFADSAPGGAGPVQPTVGPQYDDSILSAV